MTLPPSSLSDRAARRSRRRQLLLSTLVFGLLACGTTATVGEAVGVVSIAGSGRDAMAGHALVPPGSLADLPTAAATPTAATATDAPANGDDSSSGTASGDDGGASASALSPSTTAALTLGSLPASFDTQAAAPATAAAAGSGADGGPDAAVTTSSRPKGGASASIDGVPCAVQAVPRSLGLNGFYRQACVVDGLPVVASEQIDPDALVAAATVVQGMLSARPDLASELSKRRFRLGIIGVSQRAVDLPEYRDLPTTYPQTDWDAARAYGATTRRPLAAAPEENVLCSVEDTYPGQSVLTHELGHSVLDMAVIPNDGSFSGKLKAAFKAASELDVYQNTYAMTNADEYWAEGVQDFFNASRAGYGPNGGGDGYDSPIHSRDTLRQYDPTLYGLIAGVFTEVDWRPSCPGGSGGTIG